MSATPHLLDKLASLTAIRDIEILEFSLLKTLHGIFRPEQLLLLKLDPSGQLQSILSYLNDGNQLTTVSEGYAEQPELQLALRMVKQLNGPYHTRLANGYYLSAYPVLDMRTLNTCLVTESSKGNSPQDARLIQGLLQIYRNFCALIDESQRDQLTGLLNRKTFDESMERLMSLAFRDAPRGETDARRVVPDPPSHRKHWLAMVDIDHFKSINDRFGHIYGDEVLVWLGQLLRETFRDGDLLYRFGGEEFIVITENFERQDARIAFERLREKVAAFDFPQIHQVTVSCGVVRIAPGTLAHTLLDQADQALYHAKRSGRNRVCFYEELVENGEIQPLDYETGSVDLF